MRKPVSKNLEFHTPGEDLGPATLEVEGRVIPKLHQVRGSQGRVSGVPSWPRERVAAAGVSSRPGCGGGGDGESGAERGHGMKRRPLYRDPGYGTGAIAKRPISPGSTRDTFIISAALDVNGNSSGGPAKRARAEPGRKGPGKEHR